MNRKIASAVRFFALSAALTIPALAAEPTTAPATPDAADQSPAAMAREIDDLRARLNQLEAKQQQILQQQQQKETVAAVEKDANARGFGISASSFTGGYKDKRFVIQSEDGNFVLRPWIHFQFRNSTNWREGGTSVNSDDMQNGFEVRRARIGFDGNLFSPDFQYQFDWATYRGNTGTNLNGGTPVLEEAWGLYHFHDTPWGIRAGQMHDPLAHEAIVGSKYRAPEVSLQGDIFANTDTFTQAATVIYDTKNTFRFEGGLTDGERAANTNFEDYPNNNIQYDWGLAGRVEYKFFGDWREYNQMTSMGNKKDLMVLGVGVDNSQRGSTNSLSHTLDLQYATANGLFFYGSYFGRYTTNNPGIFLGAPVSTNIGPSGDPGADTYEWSLLAQVGYMLNPKVEPYIRYEYLWLAGTPAGSNNAVHDISIGFNYYIMGHNAKLTTQLMYLPNGIPINDDSNDVLINNDKQEVIFMEQFQLLL